MRIKDALRLEPGSETRTFTGWLKTARCSKTVTFFALNDGSCVASLQVVVPETLANYAVVSKADVGTSIQVTGKIVPSSGKQASELLAEVVEIIGPADETYPLQKKRHSLEYLRDLAHLRPRTNTLGCVFRVRSKLAFAIHQFFQERDFVYLQSPIITGSDCEGAGQMFQVTTLPPAEKPDYSQDFFGQKAFLTVSGQLEGEIFAHAFRDVYTFGPTFRAENSHTARHAAEFWMIEPEMAFCDLKGNMQLAEEFIKYITRYLLKHCAEDLQFFDQWVDKTLLDRLQALVETPFEVMTYTEAVAILLKAEAKFVYPVAWGIDLQSEHERYLTEQYVKKPVFLINYPQEIKAFYMRLNDDQKTVAAMDLLVPGVGEIIGGSQREERHDLLVQRLEASGLQVADYDWYLDLRKYGSTPHAGFGLGFERALMYLTGMENIRDVLPFPRVPNYIKF